MQLTSDGLTNPSPTRRVRTVVWPNLENFSRGVNSPAAMRDFHRADGYGMRVFAALLALLLGT